MPLFARVFVTVLDSSIAEDYTLRHVFEDLFKLCDWKTGVVDMTRQAISRRLNIPIEIINDCIGKLEGPDPASRDPDNDGRRIRRLDEHRDWGWQILNWQKYDAIRNRADVALRVQRHREKEKSSNELARAAGGQGAPVAVDSRLQARTVAPPLTRVRGTNRPGSVEEVIEAGKIMMIAESSCRKFWDYYEARARHDENGRTVWFSGDNQIGNWKNLLQSWLAREVERDNRDKAYPSSRKTNQKEAQKEGAPANTIVLPVQTFSMPATTPPTP